MSKIMTLIESAPGLGRDAFRDYWRERYLPDLLAIPGIGDDITRIIHNHVQPGTIRDDGNVAPADWSGISEIWFTDRAAAERFLASPAVADLARRHAGALARIVPIHMRAVTMWDHGGDHKAMKAIAFFHANPAMTRAEAQRYWNVDHVAVGAKLGLDRKLSKYIQNHTVDGFHTVDPALDYIGAPELWFNDIADANSLFADAEKVAELAIDEARFSDKALSIMMIVDEVVVHEGRLETQPA